MSEREWINLSEPRVSAEGMSAVEVVLRSGWLSAGPHAEAWEVGLAAVLGVGHVVATSSCTLATHVALAALGVGPGDEVVMPSFTWPSLVWSVRSVGALCVLADIDRASWMMSPATMTHALTPRTKAVLAVDYAGTPCDVRGLRSVLPPGVALVEDAAHAFGSSRDQRSVGTYADAAVFSFNPTKTAGVGELGAIATKNAALAQRCRALRNYGVTATAQDKRRSRDPSHDVVGPGPNAKPSELACALAAAGLAQLDRLFAARRQNYAHYRAAVATLGAPVTLQRVDADTQVVPYLLPLVTDTPERRDKILAALRDARVEAGTHYRPLHTFDALAPHVVCREPLPVTDRVANRVVTVPAHDGLTGRDVDYVVDVIGRALVGAPLRSGAATKGEQAS